MSGRYLHGNIYPFTYSEPPESVTLERTDHSATLRYVPERGECRRTMDGIDPFTQWVCDQCGHPLDASDSFCGGCGRRVMDA